jgi:hypothetical protein
MKRERSQVDMIHFSDRDAKFVGPLHSGILAAFRFSAPQTSFL